MNFKFTFFKLFSQSKPLMIQANKIINYYMHKMQKGLSPTCFMAFSILGCIIFQKTLQSSQRKCRADVC